MNEDNTTPQPVENQNICTNPPHFQPHCGCPAGCRPCGETTTRTTT